MPKIRFIAAYVLPLYNNSSIFEPICPEILLSGTILTSMLLRVSYGLVGHHSFVDTATLGDVGMADGR